MLLDEPRQKRNRRQAQTELSRLPKKAGDGSHDRMTFDSVMRVTGRHGTPIRPSSFRQEGRFPACVMLIESKMEVCFT